MTPSLLYVGELTLGACFPLLLQLSLAIELLLPGFITELNAKITGYTKLQVALGVKPPSLTGNIDLVARISSSLTNALSLGFTPPSINFGAELAAALIVKLKMQLESLQAALALALQLKSIAASAGVNLFVYQGKLADLGTPLNAQIGTMANVEAQAQIYLPLLLVETDAYPDTVLALSKLIKNG